MALFVRSRRGPREAERQREGGRERERGAEKALRAMAAFRDDFMPSGSEAASDSDCFGDLVELPGEGGDDEDEVQFVPPGGDALAPAPSSVAGFSASSASVHSAPPGQKKRKTGKTAAAATEDEGDAAPPRRLVRLTSNPKPELPTAQQLLCITGRPLKHPVPVHPVKVDSKGKQWIILNEHQNWLRRACATAGTTHYEVHFQAAITALRGEFQDLIAEARKQDTSEGQQGAIRKGLGLSDSEGEACPRASNLSRKRGVAKSELEVKFRGVTVCVLNQQRPLCVECTAPAVNAILAACRDKAEEHATAPPKLSATAVAKQAKHQDQQTPGASAPGGGTPATAQAAGASDPKSFSMGSLSAGVPTKVTWQPSAASWAVHYKDNGRTVVTRVRVKTPDSSKKSIFGSQKSKPDSEMMACLREQAFREACQRWNELDTSKRPRIDLEDSGTR